jgi:hypothetical protein
MIYLPLNDSIHIICVSVSLETLEDTQFHTYEVTYFRIVSYDWTV